MPVIAAGVRQGFRRDPEWLYGEGVGRSRAPLVMLEYALRALRSIRSLRRLRLGVMLYADEGRDAMQSQHLIRQAAGRAEQVLVCRPGTVGNGILTQRRGSRRYELTVEGDRLSPGQIGRRRTVVGWTCEKLQSIGALSSPRKRISIATLDLRTERHAMFVPHRVEVSLMMSYLEPAQADETEKAMRAALGRSGPKWRLDRLDDRPPMADRPHQRPAGRGLGGRRGPMGDPSGAGVLGMAVSRRAGATRDRGRVRDGPGDQGPGNARRGRAAHQPGAAHAAADGVPDRPARPLTG